VVISTVEEVGPVGGELLMLFYVYPAFISILKYHVVLYKNYVVPYDF